MFYKANFCDPKELPLKEEGGLAVLSGRRAVGLNPAEKKISLDDGTELSYDKCLLATGGRPKNLPVFSEASAEVKQHVSLYRAVSG